LDSFLNDTTSLEVAGGVTSSASGHVTVENFFCLQRKNFKEKLIRERERERKRKMINELLQANIENFSYQP